MHVAFGALAVVALLALGPIHPVPASSSDAYHLDFARQLQPGVEYQRLVRSEGPVVAHVIRVENSPGVGLRSILSNEMVAGSPATELTSSMCARTSCVAAINGDFFHRTGEPVGAVGRAGRLLRSPDPNHFQLNVSATGAKGAGPMPWTGRLVSADGGTLDLTGMNRAPADDGVTLYTPDYAAATPVHTSGVEVVVRVLEAPLATLAGQNALIELQSIANSDGGTPIPPDGAVLAGRGGGAAALTSLWERSRNTLLGTPVLFRLQTSTLNAESIGGSPILLREGVITVTSDGSDLVDGLHPRTVAGWNLSVTFFVVIDGRQPGYSVGADLPEAAMLLSGLGATDAINLDGGGSATLTIAGEVVNRPSDRLVVRDGKQIVVAQPAPGDVVVGNVERLVADALAIVSPTPVSMAEDLGVELVSPPPGTAIDPSADPASRPPATMMGPAGSRPVGSPVTSLNGGLGSLLTSNWAYLP